MLSKTSISVMTLNILIRKNGYKITKFLNHARVCNPNDQNDVQKCMNRLRQFHEMHLSVDHDFDIFDQINFYENLWNGKPSIYRDYQKTKDNVLSLKSYIDAHIAKKY